MISSFHNDELGYEKWLSDHPFGYVFNYLKTAEHNKLHHANCRHLYRSKDIGARTTYIKICSSNYSEIEVYANEISSGQWSKCKVCIY